MHPEIRAPDRQIGAMTRARRRDAFVLTERRLLWAGAILAGIIFAGSIFTVLRIRDKTLDAAVAELRNLDLVLAEQTAQSLRQVDAPLLRVQGWFNDMGIHDPAAFSHGAGGTAMDDRLAQRLARVAGLHAVSVFDAKGKLLAAVNTPPAFDDNIGDRTFFADLRDHPLAGALIETLRHGNAQSVVLARRISGPGGMFLGVALAAIDTNGLLELYRAVERVRGARASLVLRDGRVIVTYPPLPEGTAHRIPAGSPWFERVATGGGILRATAIVDGQPVIVAAQPLSAYPLVSDAVLRENDALDLWWQLSVGRLAIAWALALTVFGFFWSFSRNLRQQAAQNAALAGQSAALRARERQLHDFMALAYDWFWEQDENLRFRAINPLSQDPLLGSSIGWRRWEIADECADPEKWAAHRADLEARRPFHDFRYRVTLSDGVPRYLSVSGKPLFDDEGRFTGYRGIGRDITAEIDAGQALRAARDRAEAAEALLQDAIENISEGVAIFDAEERLVLCNAAYWRWYPTDLRPPLQGLTFEAIARAGIANRNYIDTDGRENNWLKERLRRFREASASWEYGLHSGNWLLVTDRRMRNGGTVGLRVDITALKQAQAALRESEDRLARAQEIAGITTWEFSPPEPAAGDQAAEEPGAGTPAPERDAFALAHASRSNSSLFGVIQASGHHALGEQMLEAGHFRMAPQLLALLGLPGAEQPTLSTLAALMPPDDAAALRAWLRKLLAGQRERALVVHLRRADGGSRVLQLDGRIISDADGTVRRIAGTAQDITERTLTEQRLAQAQKSEALGNLTGGMAHDFNNMLGIVTGNLELMRRLIPPGSAASELCDDALDGAQRCAALVKRLLAFARRQPLKPQRIDANSLIRDIVRLLMPTLGGAIDMTLTLDERLWPVTADPAQLEAALVNLVNNARDAMPDGGRLDVRTRNVSLGAEIVEPWTDVLPGDYVDIHISDTGSGIPWDIQPRIFDPFFTTKPPGAGTGLGLSMAFGFAKQSGGHISVYSEPGVGTCFHLYLPRNVAAPGEILDTDPARTSGDAGAGSRYLSGDVGLMLPAQVHRDNAADGDWRSDGDEGHLAGGE